MDEKLLEIINDIRSSKGLSLIDILKPTDNLRHDLGFDSLALANLTVQVEEEYDVDIFEDGIINTIEELMSRING
ncbi:phosphopantetheine-binding protein [Halobacteriovorax sp. RT-2-6]|uniref:phosphopantetheine-binding protein n=1 Tax=unclassified Halobacteriovorax TaxID=2639665 RepID=UPI00399B7B22